MYTMYTEFRDRNPLCRKTRRGHEFWDRIRIVVSGIWDIKDKLGSSRIWTVVYGSQAELELVVQDLHNE